MEVCRPSLQRVQGRALVFRSRVNFNGGWYQSLATRTIPIVTQIPNVTVAAITSI
jgi:hypothetical protein